MSKSDEKSARDQRLGEKLRENLKRRKGQAKARVAPATPRDGPDTKPPGKAS